MLPKKPNWRELLVKLIAYNHQVPYDRCGWFHREKRCKWRPCSVFIFCDRCWSKRLLHPNVKFTLQCNRAQGDEAKTVHLAPIVFDVKSFSWQSRSRGGGIAATYKSILCSNITFKMNSHIVRSSAGINYTTAQHTTFCFFVPPSTHSTEQCFWFLVYWIAAWPSGLHKQPPRTRLSCCRHELPLWH